MGGAIGYDHDYEHLKDRSLWLMDQALHNSETAVSNKTIAEVLSTCMYEVCFIGNPVLALADKLAQNIQGSHLIPTYLRGLRQMLDTRTSINNFPSGGGQYISEMVIL